MNEPPHIIIEVLESPTLSKADLAALFDRADSEGISAEAFVERAISRELGRSERETA